MKRKFHTEKDNDYDDDDDDDKLLTQQVYQQKG